MHKMPATTWLSLTVVPALIVGGILWFAADSIPGCTNVEQRRLPSPSGALELVVFTRDCNTDAPDNTQAALIRPGQTLPDDAEGFLALSGDRDLEPAWTSDTALSLTLPHGIEIWRQATTVETVSIDYRVSTATVEPG